jgi:hypothetical protein
MIDVTLQFAHGNSARFARHFTPFAFPVRIDAFNNLSISLCCRSKINREPSEFNRHSLSDVPNHTVELARCLRQRAKEDPHTRVCGDKN